MSTTRPTRPRGPIWWKVTFYFIFFLKNFKKWLKSAIFYKISSGGDKRRYYQKIKQNSHWQDTCGKKCYLLFLSKFVSTCYFDLPKKEYILNFNEISLKKENFFFETLISPSFDVLHSSPIVYMDRTEPIFQDLLWYCTKKVQKNLNKFFHFRHGDETHLLVLAKTLI